MENTTTLLRKYQKMPLAVKSSLWFVICNVLQKGISFLTTPIFTRLLSKDEYGQFSLFLTWYSILHIFATLELTGGVYNKGLAKYKTNRECFSSALLGLSTLATIILFFIYLCFKNLFLKHTGLTNEMLMGLPKSALNRVLSSYTSTNTQKMLERKETTDSVV